MQQKNNFSKILGLRISAAPIFTGDIVKKIKGAIFDLDGTIIDSMPMWYSLYGNYINEANIVPSQELLDFLRHASIPVAAKRFAQEFNLGTAEEIEKALYAHVSDYYKNHATAYKNVDKLIEKFHASGIKMCVATATESKHAKNALLHTGLLHYFCDVLSCKDLGIEKNKPDIYFEALKRLDVPIDDTAVFEDALHAVETAKSGGFYVVAIYEQFAENPERIKEIADKYITDYAELI